MKSKAHARKPEVPGLLANHNSVRQQLLERDGCTCTELNGRKRAQATHEAEDTPPNKTPKMDRERVADGWLRKSC